MRCLEHMKITEILRLYEMQVIILVRLVQESCPYDTGTASG